MYRKFIYLGFYLQKSILVLSLVSIVQYSFNIKDLVNVNLIKLY